MTTPKTTAKPNTAAVPTTTLVANTTLKPVVVPSVEHVETEEILRTAGQRRVNLIWEYTQAGIAIGVVASNLLYVFVVLLVPNISSAAITASGLLSNAFFLVIGFYFGRTNHARMGDNSNKQGSLDSR